MKFPAFLKRNCKLLKTRKERIHLLLSYIIPQSLFHHEDLCLYAKKTVFFLGTLTRVEDPRQILLLISRSVFSCSKLTIQTLEQGVKYVHS